MAKTREFFGKASTSASLEDINKVIAKKAFELWQKRGCPLDDDKRDWYEAERMVKSGTKK